METIKMSENAIAIPTYGSALRVNRSYGDPIIHFLNNNINSSLLNFPNFFLKKNTLAASIP